MSNKPIKDEYVKRVKFSYFVIPFVVIVSALILVTSILVNIEIDNNYEYLERNSVILTKSYSHTLNKAAKAQDIVMDLLNEKIDVASKEIAIIKDKYPEESLKILAERFNIDVAYLYTPEGKVFESNDGEYIGWEPEEGHPVYNFMKSGKSSLVEEIRPDSVNGMLYKYGYYKLQDGSFIQVGIQADKIESFLQEFRIEKILNEIHSDEVIEQACFLDNEYNLIGKSDSDLTLMDPIDQEVKNAIENNQEIGRIINYDGQDYYRTFVPFYVDDSKVGTLVISQSTKEIQDLSNRILIGGAIILLGVVVIVVIFFYIAYKKSKEAVSEAYYDNLTHLPNLKNLDYFIFKYMDEEIRDKQALILLDCTNFNLINTVYGYSFGNKVLIEIANKLKNVMKDEDMLFKIDSDRFVIYTQGYKNKDLLIQKVENIQHIFEKPFGPLIDSQDINAVMSIVEIDKKHKSAEDILKDANIAIKLCNFTNGTKYLFYNEDMKKISFREELIGKEIRKAIYTKDSDSIYLNFQPQLDIKNNKIVGFEALARMKIDSIGQISPQEFIKIAEDQFLIIQLGELLFKKACEFSKSIKEIGYEDIITAVNISPIQLLSENFPDRIDSIMSSCGVENNKIELEITESVFFNNTQVNSKLSKLREKGFKIALDDFGTGFSSLSKLRDLSLDTVKIDKTFIDKISVNIPSELITSDIISMAHKIGLVVIAEGVEDKKSLDYLIEHDCDVIQGYYFSKPLSQDDAVSKLKETNKNI